MKENIFFSLIEFEQNIVEWVDDSKVSLCPSCAKTFGLSRRKHHCRLDGFVICNQCSQFLPFSIARRIFMDIPDKFLYHFNFRIFN
jgi:hypothetical protein